MTNEMEEQGCRFQRYDGERAADLVPFLVDVAVERLARTNFNDEIIYLPPETLIQTLAR